VNVWGVDRFVAELIELGHEPVVDGNRVSIAWTIPLGPRTGEEIRIGWEVPGDWPETSPHGPHVNAGFNHPGGGNHESAFGPGWRHWSRPFNGWAASDRSMRTYLRFMHKVFQAT
jgi:hypothetical protein